MISPLRFIWQFQVFVFENATNNCSLFFSLSHYSIDINFTTPSSVLWAEDFCSVYSFLMWKPFQYSLYGYTTNFYTSIIFFDSKLLHILYWQQVSYLSQNCHLSELDSVQNRKRFLALSILILFPLSQRGTASTFSYSNEITEKPPTALYV